MSTNPDEEWERQFNAAVLKYGSQEMALLVCGIRPSERPRITYVDASHWGEQSKEPKEKP